MKVFDDTGRFLYERTISDAAIQIELPVGKYELVFFGEKDIIGVRSIVVLE